MSGEGAGLTDEAAKVGIDEALPDGAVGAAETSSPTGEARLLDGQAH